MNRNLLLPAALLAAALSEGCLSAAAGDATPDAPLTHLENAVSGVERAAVAVVTGVASGGIDLTTRGPDLVAAFTRLNLSISRTERLAERVPVEAAVEVAPVDAALAEAPVVPEGQPVPHAGNTQADTPASGTARARPPAGTPTTTAAVASEPTQKAEVGTTTTATRTTAAQADKTGIPSVDKFLQSTANLSADMLECQTKLESARGKISKSLGLAKKFKPEDAKAALKDKLGTGYKITLGPPPNIVPGPDAKDPGIVNDMKSAITDLMTVQKKIPGLISGATQAAKDGAVIPTSAKNEIMALGPMKSVDALGKVAKNVKNVTKIPKDAKDLGDEVASWTKVLGG